MSITRTSAYVAPLLFAVSSAQSAQSCIIPRGPFSFGSKTNTFPETRVARQQSRSAHVFAVTKMLLKKTAAKIGRRVKIASIEISARYVPSSHDAK
jgi:hypothetical protein